MIFKEITGKDDDYETEEVSLSDLIDCIENNIPNFELLPENVYDGKGSNIGFSPLEVIDALTRFEGDLLQWSNIIDSLIELSVRKKRNLALKTSHVDNFTDSSFI